MSESRRHELPYAAPAVVDADASDPCVVLIVKGITATRHAEIYAVNGLAGKSRFVVRKAHIEELAFQAPIGGEGPFGARASSKAPTRTARAESGRSHRGVLKYRDVAIEFSVGQTARDIQKHIVDNDAGPRPQRAEPLHLTFNRKGILGSGISVEKVRRRTEVGPAPVRLYAEHRAVQLPIVAALDTGVPTIAAQSRTRWEIVINCLNQVAFVEIAGVVIAPPDIAAEVEAAEVRAGRPRDNQFPVTLYAEDRPLLRCRPLPPTRPQQEGSFSLGTSELPFR